MNLVGKIFVVLIFVMSLFFAGLTVVVYATHTNWMEVVDNPNDDLNPGLTQKLAQAKSRNQAIEDTYAQARSDLEREKKTAIDVATKLRTEAELLKTETSLLKEKEAGLVEAERVATVALNGSMQILTEARKELAGLHLDIANARQERDSQFTAHMKAEDELFNYQLEVMRLTEKINRAAEDLQRAEAVLKWLGMDKNMDVSDKPPIGLNGEITVVVSPKIVQIKLGSDDGMRPGHALEVYHMAGGASSYVGRIIVLETETDSAVCRVDPRYQQRPVQSRDRVTTSLR